MKIKISILAHDQKVLYMNQYFKSEGTALISLNNLRYPFDEVINGTVWADGYGRVYIIEIEEN